MVACKVFVLYWHPFVLRKEIPSNSAAWFSKLASIIIAYM